MNVLVLNGPNLNLLGEREPHIYGATTLPELEAMLARQARGLRMKLRFFQSNSEGELVDQLHEQRHWADAVVLNPGGLTHTSYVLRDAIVATRLRTIEVHLSDIRKREPFRRISVVKDVCEKQISGLGVNSYTAALDYLSGG